MAGNDSFPHLEMFGEVSKPISAEISEILEIRPKIRLGYFLHIPTTYRKISIFQLSLIINYPVSYEVDKAYYVLL